GVALSWERKRFPCAWLWCKLEGNADPPWHSKTKLIGIEPNTTWPAVGMATAKAAGGTLLCLDPGAELDATLRFQALRPKGAITAVDHAGRAISGPNSSSSAIL